MRREWWLFVRAAVNFGLEKQHRWQTSPTGVINCVFHLSKEKVLTKEFVRFSKSGRKKKSPKLLTSSYQQNVKKTGEKKKKKKNSPDAFSKADTKRDKQAISRLAHSQGSLPSWPQDLPALWPGEGQDLSQEEACLTLLAAAKGLPLLLLLLSRFSRVWLCAAPWTAAYQASPSMGFSRQEHWSALPFPSPGLPLGPCKCWWQNFKREYQTDYLLLGNLPPSFILLWSARCLFIFHATNTLWAATIYQALCWCWNISLQRAADRCGFCLPGERHPPAPNALPGGSPVHVTQAGQSKFKISHVDYRGQGSRASFWTTDLTFRGLFAWVCLFQHTKLALCRKPDSEGNRGERLVVGSVLMTRVKFLDLAIPEARNPLNIPIRGANKCFPLHQAFLYCHLKVSWQVRA